MNDIRVETADRIATVILDRPPVNALTLDLYARIAEVFTDLGKSLDVNCVILAAAGTRAFSAGKDLKEFLAAKVEDDPQQAAVVRRAFSAVLHCEIPVIAAVNGPALGAGCVLASLCDFRIASENAVFGLPEINVGRCGGGSHLGRLIPQGVLRRMFFTGMPIGAAEAYRVGLVDQVTTAAELPDVVRRLALTIASKSPLGLRYGKKALNDVEFLAVEVGYKIEQEYSTRLMHTEDAREAARAAIEKRPPHFLGR